MVVSVWDWSEGGFRISLRGRSAGVDARTTAGQETGATGFGELRYVFWSLALLILERFATCLAGGGVLLGGLGGALALAWFGVVAVAGAHGEVLVCG